MTIEVAGRTPLRRAVVMGALGVVFGDIGTSPIYTFRECLKSSGNAGNEAVLGLLSLVFWALMVVVTIKYVCFVMRADNEGEGGIIALLGLASAAEADEGRRRWLVLIGLAGAALFYGDGMITPAISVLSAVEGLEVATPLLKPYVVPLTVVVLVGLFALQSRGSARIGMLFGPVMSVWFAAIALAGLWQVAQMPAVFAALDPRHGLGFLFGHGWTSFIALGSVFLALTGAEAL
jgi:KUP system potassium uptake protein